MPRKPRFYLPGIPVHVIQRGNNRQPVFRSDNDYLSYLNWLEEAAQSCECSIHAYVLMTNHVHILVTPTSRDGISRMVQHVGRNYVTYFNRRYQRSGTLWEGRHKGSVISGEGYLFTCSNYIELNPVRAGMVVSPECYRWSSYRANALGQTDSVVRPHELYLQLGSTSTERMVRYRALFSDKPLDENEIQHIRNSTQTGTPLGNDDFIKRIARLVKQRVGYSKRGRPRNRAHTNV